MSNALGHEQPGFGVYVHIPFCSSRCDYCAFATWTDKTELIDRYVDALIAEIDSARADARVRIADTVFFGGGTPSLIGAARLARILSSIDRQADAEVTVECNPESVSDELLEGLLGAGVNRISLGVQSLVDHVLSDLGRGHRRAEIERAIDCLERASIANYNLDLIYGSRAESDADWMSTLQAVLELSWRPAHISAYALTVEPGTALARDRARYPDDDVQATRYELAMDAFESAGYQWYEVSNWALPGHRCRHNESCWNQGDYRGFGCAAHSHLDGHRFSNIVFIDRYVDAVEAGYSALAAEEHLEGEARELEALELALRTASGVPSTALDLSDDRLDGLIEVQSGQIRLSRRGRLLANEVAIRLRPAGLESN